MNSLANVLSTKIGIPMQKLSQAKGVLVRN
jgi:hypothetical protein